MDATSPEAREHLLQSIDDKIKELEQSVLAWKCRRNAIVPISRLPPESLAIIFSFFFPLECDEEVYYQTLLRVTHVCRHWRETALNHSTLWGHINFVKLPPAGIAEIFARAKMAPLYLEAGSLSWSKAQFDIFERQLEAHISHTRQITLSGESRALLERFVSSAPALEFLLVANTPYPSEFIIPDSLFNGTAPKLTRLELIGCNISWKSPLLKGLRTLMILRPGRTARPPLEDWLDAFNEMPQLEKLTLHNASPTGSLGDPHVSEPRRTITLPSLDRFGITTSAEDCALALAHFLFPALTSLYVDASSHNRNGDDVRLLIPHVARNTHGPRDTAPLQSTVITAGNSRVEVLAWTAPDVDVGVLDRKSMCHSARVVFTARSNNSWWHHETNTGILDALWTHLPMNAISTLAIEKPTRLSKEFLLRHASSLATLKRVRLDTSAVGAFREALAEGPPPNGPRLPGLRKLILREVSLTALRTYRLHEILVKRVEQGVPLETLDLRTCTATDRAIQLLAETVGDVQGPAKTLDGVPGSAFSNWKGGVEFFDEDEKHYEDDEFDTESRWYGDRDSDESEDYEDEDDEDEYEDEDGDSDEDEMGHDDDTDPYEFSW